MTYNFDPDKWYADEYFLIHSKLKTGEITQNEYDEAVEILDKTVVSEDDLSKYDPLHAVYIYVQNKVSVLVEQLSDLPASSKRTNILEQANGPAN